MAIRDNIKSAQISAMKAKEKERLAAIRLILSKIKDRDIAARIETQKNDDDDLVVIDVLQKMAKQRRESIALYKEGGREELAAVEESELVIIEEFLPAQMDEAAMKAAIGAIISETGAESPKDMGKVMGILKTRHATEMDLGKASGLVKSLLMG